MSTPCLLLANGKDGGRRERWRGGRREWRRTYHIDKNIQRLPLPLLHQLRRVMLCPLGLVVLAKVAPECFLAPGAIARVGDGGKGGDGFVFARVLEELVIIGIISMLISNDAPSPPCSSHSHSHSITYTHTLPPSLSRARTAGRKKAKKEAKKEAKKAAKKERKNQETKPTNLKAPCPPIQ